MSKCIIWNGARKPTGYGNVMWMGQFTTAHRKSYCEAHGLTLDDIKGKVVMHTCDNPSCYNAEHLRIGSHVENMSDMVRKGRVPNQTMTPADVMWAKQLHMFGCSRREIADDIGVSIRVIGHVLRGGTYKDMVRYC